MFVSNGTGRQTLGGSKLCLKSRILADGSRAAAVFAENTRIFAYLGLPFGKHHEGGFVTRGKGAGFDHRCQDTVLLNLSSQRCRWMSRWAEKWSTLMKKLSRYVTVPEVSCRNTMFIAATLPRA